MDDINFEPLDYNTELLQKTIENSEELIKIKSTLSTICATLSELRRYTRSDVMVPNVEILYTNFHKATVTLCKSAEESRSVVKNGNELVNSMKQGFFATLNSMAEQLEKIQVPSHQEILGIIRQTTRKYLFSTDDSVTFYRKMLEEKERTIESQRQIIQELTSKLGNCCSNREKEDEKLDHISQMTAKLSESLEIVASVIPRSKDAETKLYQTQCELIKTEAALQEARVEIWDLKQNMNKKDEEYQNLFQAYLNIKQDLDDSTQRLSALIGIRNSMHILESTLRSYNMDRQENLSYIADKIDRLQLSLNEYHEINSEQQSAQGNDDSMIDALTEKVDVFLQPKLDYIYYKLDNLEKSISMRSIETTRSKETENVGVSACLDSPKKEKSEVAQLPIYSPLALCERPKSEFRIIRRRFPMSLKEYEMKNTLEEALEADKRNIKDTKA